MRNRAGVEIVPIKQARCKTYEIRTDSGALIEIAESDDGRLISIGVTGNQRMSIGSVEGEYFEVVHVPIPIGRAGVIRLIPEYGSVSPNGDTGKQR